MKKLICSIVAAIFLISGAVLLFPFQPSRSSLQLETEQKKPEIPAGELDPKVWGRYYPGQYASYLLNSEISQGQSKYGGSIPYSYLDKDLLLKRLFAGSSFGKDYNNKRGHVYALEDVQKTKRLSDKTPAACWTCKSPNATLLAEQMGDDFYRQPFKEIQPQIKHAISCADCHDNRSMELKVSRQPFREALKSMGRDPDNLSQTELRSAVCGQCHASYYLNSKTQKVVFPWKYGLKAEDLEQYYRSTWFTEWTHPESKAPLIKARHPEYETWSTSVHAANGAACPDCHMPKVQEGDETTSSHHWQSPLNTLERSCGKCHKDLNLKEQVLAIQDEVHSKQLIAEKAISEAIDSIKLAGGIPNSDGYSLMMARAMHRRAQWRWDFVASENSMGFHNPEEANRLLDEAIKLSDQAKRYARFALEHPIPGKTRQEEPDYSDYSWGMGSKYLF